MTFGNFGDYDHMGFARSRTGTLVAALLLSGGALFAQVCDEPFSRPSYPTRQAFCAVGDTILDAYDPTRSIRCEEMEVDHLISLRQAWASGVCGADLKRLANDPRNLRFTHWQTNRMKGYLSPEDFAARLPRELADQILEDARTLMKDYGIKSRDEAMLNRMRRIAESGIKFTRVPVAAVSKKVLARITFREIGGRTLVFVGKKAVGAAIGVGAAIEGINIAQWATDWLMTPEQDDRMEARAEMLKGIFGETQ